MNLHSTKEQKWFYLALGVVVFINLGLLLGEFSYSGYAKRLGLLIVLFFGCYILHHKKVLITCYLLLLLSLTPQAMIYPPLHLAGFDVYMFDLLSGAVFVYYMAQLLLSKQRSKGIQQIVNKYYFILLAIGLFPVLAEVVRGKYNIMSSYRFFFYFIWVPVIVKLVQEHRHPAKILKYMLFVNLVTIIIAFAKHFSNRGFCLYYLDISGEMVLFILLVIFSACLFHKSLFGNDKMNLIMFLFLLFILIVHHSRKMYLAFSVSGILLYYAFGKMARMRMVNISFRFLIVMLFLMAGLCYFGIFGDFVDRAKSIFVLPIEENISKVDSSVGFRIYAISRCLKTICKYPLAGIGTGESMQLLDYGGRNFYGFTVSSPHNYHLQGLVSYGVPVMILVYGILIKLLRLSWKSIKKQADADKTFIAMGTFFGFIGFMVAMCFEGFEVATMLIIWLFFGLVVGFANIDHKNTVG